jgi:predicted DNA-binding ribbon-helix-helix protein
MKRFAVLVSVAVLGVALAPEDAEACGRFKEFRKPQVNEELRDVRRSEHLLAQGKFDKAAKLARRAFPGVTKLPASSKDQALFHRAQRVAALAAMRAGGDVKLGRTKPKDEYDKAVNLQWAHHVLMFHAAKFEDNLVIRTQYAESAATVPGLESYAYDMLREMAEEDLMPTARGFALLAQLQQSRGDSVGFEVSVKRCREIGAEDSVCNIA